MKTVALLIFIAVYVLLLLGVLGQYLDWALFRAGAVRLRTK